MKRSSGILLPLASLPGAPYCGDLGGGARQFVDFLAAAGQSWWQMLPINPIDECFSPYASHSAFAGEPLYLSLSGFVRDGLLDAEDVTATSGDPKNRIAYTAARDFRAPRWKKAFERFCSKKGSSEYRNRYDKFVAENESWIWSHGFFCALAEKYGTEQWSTWPDKDVRRADSAALRIVAEELNSQIAFHVFLQLVFDIQWRELREYCQELNVKLIGDIPIYVGKNSRDTWANSSLFQMDEDGRLERVAGAPGDGFNPDGQRWNSPLYRWEAHEQEGWNWWKERIRCALRHFDVLRLDHFIGFHNYYSFSADETDTRPESMYWTPGPGAKFFDAMFAEFPQTAFIAEDLGVLTPGVHALRDRYDLPGMNVFQFAFDNRRNTDPTVEWKPNSVVCSGTHDTNTISGWLDEVIADRKKPHPAWDYSFIYSKLKDFIPYLDPNETFRLTKTQLCQAVIRMTMNSPGNTSIFPMQDVLRLGSDARMNFPGHAENNWLWRLSGHYLTTELEEDLRDATVLYGRAGR